MAYKNKIRMNLNCVIVENEVYLTTSSAISSQSYYDQNILSIVERRTKIKNKK